MDKSQLLPAMGLLPTLGKGGKPVLNLEFLLDDVVRNTVPLDWCVLFWGLVVGWGVGWWIDWPADHTRHTGASDRLRLINNSQP